MRYSCRTAIGSTENRYIIIDTLVNMSRHVDSWWAHGCQPHWLYMRWSASCDSCTDSRHVGKFHDPHQQQSITTDNSKHQLTIICYEMGLIRWCTVWLLLLFCFASLEVEKCYYSLRKVFEAIVINDQKWVNLLKVRSLTIRKWVLQFLIIHTQHITLFTVSIVCDRNPSYKLAPSITYA